MKNGCNGTRVSIRRTQKQKEGVWSVSELRLYQVPNLLDIRSDKVQITGPPASDENNWAIKNLITNLDVRTGGHDQKPFLNPSQEKADFYSCYKIAKKDISLTEPFVVTIDL